jgi:plastocyanin
MGKKSLAALGISLVLSACGGGGSAQNQAASSPPASAAASASAPGSGAACSPNGASLEVSTLPTAIAFDTRCLAAPANTDFTITFNNRSPSVPHDVSIATPGQVDVLFEGEIITGPKTTTYQVKGIAAGTYEFYCKVHPSQMNGTFVVA